MATYNTSVTASTLEFPYYIAAGTTVTMSIDNPFEKSSYFTIETVSNNDGFYTSTSPKNISGSLETGSGIINIVSDDYKTSVIVAPGGGTLYYTPSINIEGDTLNTRGISGVTGKKPFTFTINTANTSSGSTTNTQFKLPLVSSLPLNAIVDWGDGTTDTITTFNQAETTHTYSTPGVYKVRISGQLSGWAFNSAGDRLKMLNVVTWGALNISISGAFNGCTNLTCSATDAPLITSTSLVSYFLNCTNFNGAIGNWDTSAVTNMSSMFQNATAFNQNIGSWNVSSVTRFDLMFLNAFEFNNGGATDINNWTINTTSAVNMSNMFQGASSFNQNIGSWNVSNVTSFVQMFFIATAFNNGGSDDINNWTIKTTGTVNMSGMFGGSNTTISCKFNRYIGDWNTSAVNNMSSMFANNTAFNQNIGSWNVSNVTNFSNFMVNKTNLNYSAANLDSIYNGWSSRPVNPNLSINFGTIKFTAAGVAGKAILTGAPNNWTIVDGGI